MARYEQLDSVAHRDQRVATGFGVHFGDNMAMVPVFPGEYALLQREYPLYFRRDPAGGYQSVALLGFDHHENLYLQRSRWTAEYLPATVARGPFLIGFRERGDVDGNGEGDGPGREPVIHVDMAHPRVIGVRGERVFLADGSHSPYLQHILGVLRGIHDGVAEDQALASALDEMELIRPLSIDVDFGDGHGVTLGGLHGIDRQRLSALDAVSLSHLHRSGRLEAVYLLLASQLNLERLVGEKRRRLAAAR